MKIKVIEWSGRQITKPGIYSGIPLELYHDPKICIGPSISSSMMRAIFGDKKSPAHFYAKWQGNPNRDPYLPALPRHYALGQAVHHLTLGQPHFAKLFCMRPDKIDTVNRYGLITAVNWNGNRQECKDWIAARAAEGRTWLTKKEVHAVREMSRAIGNHPIVRQGGLNGLVEHSIFWVDKETGLWIKARPDTIPTDSADFVDVKTIFAIWEIGKHVTEYGYNRQVAVAREAARIVLDTEMASFTLLFAESRPPWDTKDVTCVAKDIDQGELANRAAIRIFAKCIKDAHWPGIGEDVGTNKVELSDEARERMDKKLHYQGLGS